MNHSGGFEGFSSISYSCFKDDLKIASIFNGHYEENNFVLRHKSANFFVGVCMDTSKLVAF